MSNNQTITEVMKVVGATVDKARKTRVISALREGADLLEKDPRPFEEATLEIFAQVIATLAQDERGMASDDDVAHQARELAVEARRILQEEE